MYRFLGIADARSALLWSATVDPRERATSVWYRVAGLLRRKDLAIEIIEGEIRSAQHGGAPRGREAGADWRANRDRTAAARARGAHGQAEVDQRLLSF
jgi:hypothetical protein